MTTAYPIAPRDLTQTDLIRYVDRFTIEAKARHDRAELMGEMIGGGIAWLWQRVTHLGDTRSPAPAFHTSPRAHV